MDSEDGSTLWEYETGNVIQSSPAVYGGKLYIGSGDHNVYCFGAEGNQPPDTPIIDGPTHVNTGETVRYNITFSDPDGSITYLYVEAFDLESGVWWGPYYIDNPQWQTLSFTPEEGEYTIRAKAKDPYEAESDWAVLEVSVPKSKIINDFNPWISRLIERFPILKLIL